MHKASSSKDTVMLLCSLATDSASSPAHCQTLPLLKLSALWKNPTDFKHSVQWSTRVQQASSYYSLPHHFQSKGGNLFWFSCNKLACLAREIPRKDEQTFPGRWVMTSWWKGITKTQQHLLAPAQHTPSFWWGKSSSCPRSWIDVPTGGACSTNPEPHP